MAILAPPLKPIELKFVFIAKMNNTVRSLPPFTTEDVILAAGIIECMAAIDSFIVDGIVRFDISKSNDNKLVLNQFESLEANYYGDGEGNVREFVEQYWEHKIYDCINSLSIGGSR